MFGVIIEKDPQYWEIIGQSNGETDISLSGYWTAKEGMHGKVRKYLQELR